MLTDTEEGRTLINEAAYAIIQENAAQEQVFYVKIRDQYLADPEQFLVPPESEDKVLAFGPGIPLDTLTQVVFPVLAPMLVLLIDEAVKAMGKDMGTGAITWVRSLFRDEKPKEAPTFTPEQLVAIKKEFDVLAAREAARLQLDKAKVQTVRDALITRLTMKTT